MEGEPMTPDVKVYLLDQNGERIFGEGPYRLLAGVEATGSLRRSAQEMGMAYTKAIRLVRRAEEALGFPLTCPTTGGKSGGGSTLTPRGKELLRRYEAYRDACHEANRRIYGEIFGDTL